MTRRREDRVETARLLGGDPERVRNRWRGGSHPNQEGDHSDDVLRGTEEPDLLDGRATADRIFGDGGEDSLPELPEVRGFLIGGKGDDVVHGGSGDDHMIGSGLFGAFSKRRVRMSSTAAMTL
jgi:hypothetical protein